MSIVTRIGVNVSNEIVQNYADNLVNRFYKILPIKESGEESVVVYMESLQAEIIGCGSLIPELMSEQYILSLASILQYLIDTPECDHKVLKREVFKAISVCNKIRDKYNRKS